MSADFIRDSRKNHFRRLYSSLRSTASVFDRMEVAGKNSNQIAVRGDSALDPTELSGQQVQHLALGQIIRALDGRQRIADKAEQLKQGRAFGGLSAACSMSAFHPLRPQLTSSPPTRVQAEATFFRTNPIAATRIDPPLQGERCVPHES